MSTLSPNSVISGLLLSCGAEGSTSNSLPKNKRNQERWALFFTTEEQVSAEELTAGK